MNMKPRHIIKNVSWYNKMFWSYISILDEVNRDRNQ